MRNRDLRRPLAALCLAVLAGLLLLDLAKLTAGAIAAIHYPYELDYGEGIVWQQLANIAGGTGYAPLGVFPAIVYHYPPVYHLAAAALAAAAGLDQLFAGRLLSALATAATLVAIGWWALAATPASRRGWPKWLGATFGAASFATSTTVLYWSSMMRVDMLASALTLGGLLCAIGALRKPGLIFGAALLSALAVFAKQTAILGPIAILATLMSARPALAWRFGLWCGGFGFAALATAMVVTDGEFLRHVLTYNVNRFDPTQLGQLGKVLAVQVVSLTLGLAAAVATVRRIGRHDLRARLRASPRDTAAALALVYLALRILTVPLILKSGARDNYLIDLYAIVAVFVGIPIADVVAAAAGRGQWPRALVTALVLVGLPVQAGRLWRAPGHVAIDPQAEAALVTRIRAADRPVISDDMVLLRRAGKPVLFEPAIVAELAHAGRYDEAALVHLVRQQRFAFFVTRGVRGGRLFDERYNPPVAAAIAAAYPRLERVGDLTLHLPAADPAAPPPR